MSGSRAETLGEPFAVEVEHAGDRVLMRVRGELDMGTTPELELAVPPLPVEGHCTIDLREVSFMDSTAVHALMGLDLRARAEGWTVSILHVPDSAVGRLLERCRVAERVELLG